MGTPSACWRRPDNLAVTSSACRKQGELGKQSFLQQDTEFSALAKKDRKAGKDCTGVGSGVRETICRKSVDVHQLVDERLMSMRFELTGESVAINLDVAYAPTETKLNTTHS